MPLLQLNPYVTFRLDQDKVSISVLNGLIPGHVSISQPMIISFLMEFLEPRNLSEVLREWELEESPEIEALTKSSILIPAGVQVEPPSPVTVDMDSEDFRKIYRNCKPFSMLQADSMYGIYQAVEYIVRSKIPGSLVFCGVWRGGSAMAGASTLMQLGATDRDIYLYDTFSGTWSEPTAKDGTLDGTVKPEDYALRINIGSKPGKAPAGTDLESVRRNLLSTGYPGERLRFVPGFVEETIPGVAPEKIALLRLDTNFYASTLHELKHLYPRVSLGGVTIIDDYGEETGSKSATDEYLSETRARVLLSRNNEQVRSLVKCFDDKPKS